MKRFAEWTKNLWSYINWKTNLTEYVWLNVCTIPNIRKVQWNYRILRSWNGILFVHNLSDDGMYIFVNGWGNISKD